jgi:hypothetical protein
MKFYKVQDGNKAAQDLLKKYETIYLIIQEYIEQRKYRKDYRLGKNYLYEAHYHMEFVDWK